MKGLPLPIARSLPRACRRIYCQSWVRTTPVEAALVTAAVEKIQDSHGRDGSGSRVAQLSIIRFVCVAQDEK